MLLFTSKRLREIWFRPNKFYGTTTARVCSAFAGVVLLDATRDVCGDACVQTPIAATSDVNGPRGHEEYCTIRSPYRKTALKGGFTGLAVRAIASQNKE